MSVVNLSVSDSEIARLCGYITNDRDVASYLGVSVARVERARLKLRVKDGRGRLAYVTAPAEQTEPMGVDVQKVAEASGASASRMLCNAMIGMYNRVAAERGITRADAEKVLIAGRKGNQL